MSDKGESCIWKRDHKGRCPGRCKAGARTEKMAFFCCYLQHQRACYGISRAFDSGDGDFMVGKINTRKAILIHGSEKGCLLCLHRRGRVCKMNMEGKTGSVSKRSIA